MKFIYLGITAVLLVVCIVLGFSIAGNNKAIKGKEEDIRIATERMTTISAELEELKANHEAAQADNEAAKQKYEKVKLTMGYKKIPTAFLTFDDGPSKNTAAILDILAQSDIKATFFCSARQIDGTTAYDDVIHRIVNEGHTLAVHTYNHEYEEIYKSKDAYFADLEKAIAILEEKSGVKIQLVRLPSGTSSAKGFCKKYSGSDTLFAEIMEELVNRGFTVSDWNIDTNDWSSKTTPESIATSVKSESKRRLTASYKTALVLMHNKEKSLAALPGVIQSLKDNGFTFEAMQPGGYTYIQKTK